MAITSSLFIDNTLIMPILSPWSSTVSKRGEQAFIGVWFITTFYHYGKDLLPKLFGDWFPKYFYGECVWNELHLLWYFSEFIGYLVLAHYIRTYINWSRTKNLYIDVI